MKMENNAVEKFLIKNRACYQFHDLIKSEDFDPDHFDR